jgi:hypothetical protein
MQQPRAGWPNNTLIARDKIVYGLPGRGVTRMYTLGIQFIAGTIKMTGSELNRLSKFGSKRYNKKSIII